MKRDISLFLTDILVSIEMIKEYCHAIPENEFVQNRQLQDAVLRRLEVIGEAAKHIPEGFRKKHPTIPWKRMAGLRDVLIHEYFGVSPHRIWRLIEDELDVIRTELKALKI